MNQLRKRKRTLSPLGGYIGSLEQLAIALGVTLEEARVYRITVMELYITGETYGYCLEQLTGRGYSSSVTEREWLRCEEINETLSTLLGANIVNKAGFEKEFRDRVMCVGGLLGEVSKDEIASILSGFMLDSRVGVSQKLTAADLLGKYRDYYKSSHSGEVTIRIERSDSGGGTAMPDIDIKEGIIKMG